MENQEPKENKQDIIAPKEIHSDEFEIEDDNKGAQQIQEEKQEKVEDTTPKHQIKKQPSASNKVEEENPVKDMPKQVFESDVKTTQITDANYMSQKEEPKNEVLIEKNREEEEIEEKENVDIDLKREKVNRKLKQEKQKQLLKEEKKKKLKNYLLDQEREHQKIGNFVSEGKILINIECCYNCQAHQYCTHHNEAKYNSTFETFKKEIEKEIKNSVVARNYKISSPTMGAFEIYYNNEKLFSKLEVKKWPNTAVITSKLRGLIQNANAKA